MVSVKDHTTWIFVTTLITFYGLTCQARKQPHIVFILADDLGWDDVGFHGSSQIPTPNIDELANNGVILNNYYVSPICTPTRASIMSGKYPIHLGIQHFVIFAAQPYGLPLKEVTIAQYLKTLGYRTHGVGKWHLGFFAKEYTPVYRGFDSFYGFWNGKEDYWDHSSFEKFDGYDLRDNMQPVSNETGVYGTELFTREAVKVINNHDRSQPMFLYVAQQAVHSANPNEPLQAPQRLKQRFGYIKHPQRRTYAGMVTALDESVRDIKLALQSRDMLKDAIIIFSTDNGGAPYGFNWNMGSNFPFRAGKDTVWEGGVRGTAFVYSDLIQKRRRVCDELLDVTDWVPTLYFLAGGNPDLITPNLDGKNVWHTISQGIPSPRDEILHNIDPRRNFAAIRKGKFKLVVGQDDTYKIGWHPRYPNKGNPSLNTPQTLPGAVIECGTFNSDKMCNSKGGKACLFDMSQDPCEYHDVSDQYPHVVKRLKDRLAYYRSTAKPVWYPGLDESADPEHFDKFWSPWIVLQDNSSVQTSWTNVQSLVGKQMHLDRLHNKTHSHTSIHGKGLSVN